MGSHALQKEHQMTPIVLTELSAFNFNLDTTEFSTSHSFMHDLAREGDVLSAEVIFEAGSEIDLPNDEGRRPLHEAAFFGHIDMVKFFLASGAALDAPVHPFGHTALYLAVQQSHYEIAQYLIKRGAGLGVRDSLLGTGLLHIAAAKNDMRMTGILIAAGANVFSENRKGQTARDIAARAGHAGLAKTLLKVMEHHAKYVA
jgi:ankyrin repeat protein